jgi:PAS domain S-box-containing protein
VVDTGKPANVVHWAQPLGRWYEAHAFRLEPERFAIVFLDMTERKQAETAVQESEERLRTLADNIPLLCWMAEPNGHVFWYNQRWHEYTGLFPKEIEGWGWQAVHDPAELPAVLVGWQRSIASGEPFEAVFPLRGADGTFRPFLTRAVPIRSETGQVTRWFGTNTEVKDIVDAREALARSRAELERLVEERTAALLREVEERRKAEEALRQGEKLAALGQLTGGIAHDFNNILQVVSSGATLLRYPRLTEERREAVLDGLSKAAESAKDLTGRLLAFARKQTLRPETFDVNARLEHMSELLRQTLGSRIVVETDFAADLWPAFADPSQLEVAVLNLAVNARDAMLPKGGTLIVQTCNTYLEATSERMAGEYVRLVVKDTGRGMPPSVLARVFEPFFTTKGPDRGTGLGLAQVHGFTKQSGGDITVQSTPGQGTTITLHLARATAAQMDAPAAPAKETAGAGLARTAGKTVLVVEDNPDVGSFTVGLLENLGYATRSAANAAEALALIERGEAVDAVFSDVVMPGEMNGVTLASELRMRFPHLAVVLATGYSEVLAQWNGRAAAEVLRKPYRLEEVAAALERAFVAVGAGTPEADGRERA